MRKFNPEFRSLSGKLSRRQPDGTYKRITITDARLLLNDFSARLAELEKTLAERNSAIEALLPQPEQEAENYISREVTDEPNADMRLAGGDVIRRMVEASGLITYTDIADLVWREMRRAALQKGEKG